VEQQNVGAGAMKAVEWMWTNLKVLYHALVKAVTGAAQSGGGALAAAVEYLSPLPAFWNEAYDRNDVERSPLWFPAVGLILGLIAGFFTWLFGLFIPSLALGGLATLFILKSTGGQGPAGLASLAGTVLKSPLREKIVQPPGGQSALSGGAFVAFAAIVAKAVMLGSLGPWQCARAVVLILVAGRAAMVIGLMLGNCTADDDAIERRLWGAGRSQDALISALVIWGLTALLLMWSSGLFAFVLGGAYAALFAVYCNRTLGGLDGSRLFALGEAAELVTALVLVIGRCG